MVTMTPPRPRASTLTGSAAPLWIGEHEQRLLRLSAERDAVRMMAYVESARRHRLSPGRAGAAAPGAYHAAIPEHELNQLRLLGRALCRESLLARAIVDRVVQLVLGSGYTLAIAHEDQEWTRAAEAALAEEVSSINADLRRIVRMVLVDGDVLAIWGNRGEVHHVPADRVTAPDKSVSVLASQGRILAYGVEMDELGRATAYHVTPYSYDGRTVHGEPTRYAAESCTLIAELDWMGQPRGMPRLGAAYEHIQRLEDFCSDTAIAAALQAHLAYYTRTRAPDLFAQALPAPAPSPAADATMDSTPRQGVSQPGQVLHLGHDEEIGVVGPTQPGPEYDPFVLSQLRALGAAFGLPLEALMLDFSRTNFHSGKSALLLSQRAVDQWHALLLPYLRRRYAHALDHAIASSAIPAPGGPAWRTYAHEWLRPAAPVLDPEGMARADADAIASRTDSYAAVLGRRGVDWREHLEQVAREQSLLVELGVTPQPLQGAAQGTAAAQGTGQDADQPGQSDADAHDADAGGTP